jgi:primosomal protein N'
MHTSPLIEHLLSGNYKSFLTTTLAERKKYGYPPYGELVTLFIRDINKEKVTSIITKLANKIQIFLDALPPE